MVITAVPHSIDVVRINKAAVAMIRPAVTGISPACMSRRQLASRNRCHTV